MKRKPYPVTKLTGGLNISLNAAFLTDTQSPNLKVLRFDKGIVKKEVGFANLGTGERIINGNMETANNWTSNGSPTNCAQSNAEAHGGTYSWYVGKNTAANQGIRSANFPLVANANYVVTAWIKSIEANGNAGSGYIQVYSDATLQMSFGAVSIPGNNTWTQMTNNFTCNATCNAALGYALITLAGAGVAAANVYIDDVSITCSNPTDERIMFFDTYYLTSGVEHTICCTPTRMYEYTSNVWTPVPTSALWTGDADNQFSAVSFEDVYIITNGKDVVKKWTGGEITPLGGLSGISVTYARAVTNFNSRVILGNLQEGGASCPYRVRWCAAGEHEQWDPATYVNNAGFIDLIETPDWIVGFSTLIDRLFVFKERSIWELIATKDNRVFEPRLVIDGVGTYAESTIINLGDALIFFGTDDVYLFDGASLKSVGEPLYHWFYVTGEKRVNSSKLNRTACAYIEELGAYVLCLPTSTDDPDWMVSYDVNEQSWTQRDKEITAFGFWSQQDTTLWSEATSAWNSGDWASSWASKQLPLGAPITLLGDTTGLIQKDDRIQTTTEQMLWESKDFIFGHSERIVGVGIKCKGNGNATVYYSTDQGLTWDTGQTFTPDPDTFTEEKRFYNFTCDFVRFRIVTLATDFQLLWLEPWYVDRSRTSSPSLA